MLLGMWMTWYELRMIWGGVKRVHDVHGRVLKREHAAGARTRVTENLVVIYYSIRRDKLGTASRGLKGSWRGMTKRYVHVREV